MPSDQGEASAVLQEVHILASLEHPFIVRYFDSFVETRKLFLVMEYAPNGSLHTVLQHHQRLGRHVEEDTIWRYVLQLLLGLHAIHQRRIVHRDLKPHNIFLGADDTVKIGDFGVSRLLSGSADMATTLVGSPGYLAPELCSGEPYDEKADIWALGVTLVELCALKHPFGGAGSQVPRPTPSPFCAPSPQDLSGTLLLVAPLRLYRASWPPSPHSPPSLWHLITPLQTLHAGGTGDEDHGPLRPSRTAKLLLAAVVPTSCDMHGA